MELPAALFGLSSAELITYSTLAVSILFSVFFILLTACRRIRNSIPSRVNCWFCNENSKVLFAIRNNWTCPKCQQYNGFTKDGNYNKRIPAQYIESLNRPIRGAPAKGFEVSTEPLSNGLCSQCNMNQELKCFQLASFIPASEKHFDSEIEIEQKRLEKIYDLCEPCKVIVRQTLKRNPSEKENSTVMKKSTAATELKRPPRTCVPTPAGSSRTLGLGGILPWAKKIVSSPSSQSQGENTFANSTFSDSEPDEEENNCKMERLRIGTSLRVGETSSSANVDQPASFEVPDQVFNPISTSPSPSGQSFYSTQYPTPPLSVTPPTLNHNSQGQGNGQFVHSLPLWRDYPMVPNSQGIPSCYSFCDNYTGYPIDRHVSRPTFAYNYRSSSMASVFGGGRKPLICPPKLSYGSLSYHQQPQQAGVTSFGGYGVFYKYGTAPCKYGYGSNPAELFISPQHQCGHPLSRSSSQSSGFVSQYGMGTPADSRLSTAPNSLINEAQQTYPSTPDFSELKNQCKSNKNSPVHLQEPLFHSNGFRFTANNAYLGQRPQSASAADARLCGICDHPVECCNKSLTGRYSQPRYAEDKASKDDPIFSDDEDDEELSSSTSAETSIPQSVLLQRKVNTKEAIKSSKIGLHGSGTDLKPIDIESRFAKYRQILFQFCLRLFVFLNILFIFCLFFVGKWPEPLDVFVDIVNEMFHAFLDYLIITVPNWVSSASDSVIDYLSPADTASDIEVDADFILGLRVEL